MKKQVILCLILSILLMIACPANAAVLPTVEPRYTNVYNVNCAFDIDSSGLATVTVNVKGNTTLQKTDILIYLERRIGSAWARVDLSLTDDGWVYSTTDRVFTETFSAVMTYRGEYRAVIECTFTGTAPEIVSKTIYDVW